MTFTKPLLYKLSLSEIFHVK